MHEFNLSLSSHRVQLFLPPAYIKLGSHMYQVQSLIDLDGVQVGFLLFPLLFPLYQFVFLSVFTYVRLSLCLAVIISF